MTDATESSAADPAPASQPAPESAPEPPMDIRKPKPVHSWRALASEIGVIVIGVTIALAGEQGVEWLHWRHEVADTRAALIAELTANLASVAETRQSNVCTSGLLTALEGWAGNPSAKPILSSGGSMWMLQTSAWEIAKTGQGAAHVPLDERLALARTYNQIAEANALTEFRRQVTRDLLGLTGGPGLTQAQRERMLEDVTQLRILYDIWSASTGGFEAEAKRLGAKPPPAAPPLKYPHDCRLPASALAAALAAG